MQPNNIAKFTGDGAVHAISAVPQGAKWVQVVAETIASALVPARVGGTQVTSAIGAPLFQQGASQFFPQDTCDLLNRYELETMFYFAATGDVISVSWGI